MRYWLERGERLLFWIFLVSIPFQTRIILFQRDWYFNEWRSGFLYLTDLLLVALFLFSVFSKDRWRLKDKKVLVAVSISFWFFALASGFFGYDLKISLYQIAKLGELLLLFWYFRGYARYRFSESDFLWTFAIGGLIQSFIALGQFILQHDLGLRLLGESFLIPNLHGVASFFLTTGEKIMRAYGTTPHPNVLATYLLVSITAFSVLYFKRNLRSSRRTLIGFFLCYGLLLFAFFLTFSRVVLLAWVGGLGIFFGGLVFYKRDYKLLERLERKAVWQFVAMTVGISLLFGIIFYQEVISRIKISRTDEAVQLRIFYAQETFSGASTKNINWLGVGPGNFVTWLIKYDPHLPRHIYQPVHNIYLLIFSEQGIAGSLIFAVFVGLSARTWFLSGFSFRSRVTIALMGCFLFIGFFDHFFWTLQQGRIMWWLLLGLL